jgi:hypothetical protein
MKKTASRMIITLSEPLRKEIKKAAKEAHLTESAFIREAIKSRLRNPPADPLDWLQPEQKDLEVSKAGKLLLLMVAQLYVHNDQRVTPDERKLAGERAKKIVDEFF